MFEESHFESVCSRVNIRWDEIKSKAMELLRKSMVKFPIGTTGPIESYRHIICIEIACRLLNVSFQRKSLSQAACVSETDYQRAVTVMKNALNIDWQTIPVMDALAIKFGTTFKGSANELLAKYQAHLSTAPLAPTHQRTSQDISKSAVHHAAAFYLTLRQRKINVDREKLIQAAEVDRSQFQRVCEAMSQFYGQSSASKKAATSSSVSTAQGAKQKELHSIPTADSRGRTVSVPNVGNPATYGSSISLSDHVRAILRRPAPVTSSSDIPGDTVSSSLPAGDAPSRAQIPAPQQSVVVSSENVNPNVSMQRTSVDTVKPPFPRPPPIMTKPSQSHQAPATVSGGSVISAPIDVTRTIGSGDSSSSAAVIASVSKIGEGAGGSSSRRRLVKKLGQDFVRRLTEHSSIDQQPQPARAVDANKISGIRSRDREDAEDAEDEIEERDLYLELKRRKLEQHKQQKMAQLGGATSSASVAAD